MVNRDEKRSRAAALPPARQPIASGQTPSFAEYPVDPQGGGTWVALRDDGFVFVTMNVKSGAPQPPETAVSRGQIIAGLLAAQDERDVADRLSTYQLEQFAPFRLVVVPNPRDGLDECCVSESLWNGGVLAHRTLRLGAWSADFGGVCRASSGRGDALVQERLTVFERSVLARPPADRPAAQVRFHALSWPGRGVESVLMSREDARTVSVTTVDVTQAPGAPATALMTYRALPDMPPNVPPFVHPVSPDAELCEAAR